MVGIHRCLRLASFTTALAGTFAIGMTAALAQQTFTAPPPDGYPPNWNRAMQEPPANATFVPGSDAYHWVSNPAAASAAPSRIVYQMEPGSAHYHHVQ